MAKTISDFDRLLKAAAILQYRGNVAAAGEMLTAAEELIAPSTIGLCSKCRAKRDRQLMALRDVRDARGGNGADKAELHSTESVI